MRYLGNWYEQDPMKKWNDKNRTADHMSVRGTDKKPSPPRDIVAQNGPRGLFVTWSLPERDFQDIVGWRVYKNDEKTLYADVRDRGTRQCFIEATAGSVPPVTNVFVSSMSSFGTESPKVQTQGKATVEAGAPPMPSVPPGYNQGGAGGGDTYAGRNPHGGPQAP